MGDDDIEVRAFAEQNLNPGSWDSAVRFEGNCLIGCKGRKMLNTKNLVKALMWWNYHAEGAEHVGNLLKRSGGDLNKMPEVAGTIVFDSTNGEETQP